MNVTTFMIRVTPVFFRCPIPPLSTILLFLVVTLSIFIPLILLFIITLIGITLLLLEPGSLLSLLSSIVSTALQTTARTAFADAFLFQKRLNVPQEYFLVFATAC